MLTEDVQRVFHWALVQDILDVSVWSCSRAKMPELADKGEQ